METCASFWNEPGSAKTKSGDIRDSLPSAFPLADQMEDQKKGGTDSETEGEESDTEDEGKKDKKKKGKDIIPGEIQVASLDLPPPGTSQRCHFPALTLHPGAPRWPAKRPTRGGLQCVRLALII